MAGLATNSAGLAMACVMEGNAQHSEIGPIAMVKLFYSPRDTMAGFFDRSYKVTEFNGTTKR